MGFGDGRCSPRAMCALPRSPGRWELVGRPVSHVVPESGRRHLVTVRPHGTLAETQTPGMRVRGGNCKSKRGTAFPPEVLATRNQYPSAHVGGASVVTFFTLVVGI